MQQLELFEFKRDCLFDSKNQIAHYFDVLKETKDTIVMQNTLNLIQNFQLLGCLMKSM